MRYRAGMHRLAWLLLAACAHRPELPAPEWVPPEVSGAHSDATPGELVPLPGGHLGFVEQGCEVTSPCGCGIASSYRYSREGERVIIEHQLPRPQTVPGLPSCVETCTPQPPVKPSRVRDLGDVSPARVERRDVPYTLTYFPVCTTPSSRSK